LTITGRWDKKYVLNSFPALYVMSKESFNPILKKGA